MSSYRINLKYGSPVSERSVSDGTGDGDGIGRRRVEYGTADRGLVGANALARGRPGLYRRKTPAD